MNLFMINGILYKKNKFLGAGMVGATYLVEDKNKNKYALKLQKIFKSEIKKTFNKEIWRELDLYKSINKFKQNEQQFFTKLYDYEIVKNCNFKHKRPFKVSGEQEKSIKKLDKSPYCIKFLLQFHGLENYQDYIINNYKNISVEQYYSFYLQIINIIKILNKYGYSHNDIHGGNIMIKRTKEEYFIFKNKKIPFHGIKLIIIDYGEVLHKKFGKGFLKDKPYLKEYLKSKRWLFYELYYSITSLNILLPNIISLNNYVKKHKKQPWDNDVNVFKFIQEKHKKFFSKNLKKFCEIFNKKSLYNYYNKNKTLQGYNNDNISDIIINSIIEKFNVEKNNELNKYLGIKKINHKFPTNYVLKFLNCKNPTQIIQLGLDMIKKDKLYKKLNS